MAPLSTPQPDSCEAEKNDNTSASSFMTLVDAATSILDKPSKKEVKEEKEEEMKIDEREGNQEKEEEEDPKRRSSTPIAKDEDFKTASPPTSASPVESITSSIASFTSIASSQSIRKDPNKKSFADTLMIMLLDQQYSKVVTFLPDNQSWGIINAKKFSDEVMPKVFNIRTFSSFVRKLNRWGFERIMEKKTHDVDVFRHVLFKKGDLKNCAKIRCIGRLAKTPHVQKPISSSSLSRAAVAAAAAARVTPSPRGKLPCAIYSQALHDVTSQVVSAALETLRRDETVASPPAPPAPPLTSSASLQLMARRQVRAEMLALQKQADANKAMRYAMSMPRVPRMFY